MLLWELLSGRRHKNKNKETVRHNVEPAVGAGPANTVVPSSLPSVSPSAAGLNNVSHQVEVDRPVHHPALGTSLSSPVSSHTPMPVVGPSPIHSPLPKPAPLFRPSVPFNSRTPDSIKLFKNSVLSRRHSTSAGLNPGLLGPSALGGAGGVGGVGGAQRARRRRGEDAQRFSDRRRQHKYRTIPTFSPLFLTLASFCFESASFSTRRVKSTDLN